CRPRATAPRQSRSPDDEPDRLPMPTVDRCALPPQVFDRHVPALDIAGFRQALAKRGQELCILTRRPSLRNPTTGIAGCCARALSGHATAAPPTAKMNSRRLMCCTQAKARNLPHHWSMVTLCNTGNLAGNVSVGSKAAVQGCPVPAVNVSDARRRGDIGASDDILDAPPAAENRIRERCGPSGVGGSYRRDVGLHGRCYGARPREQEVRESDHVAPGEPAVKARLNPHAGSKSRSA